MSSPAEVYGRSCAASGHQWADDRGRQRCIWCGDHETPAVLELVPVTRPNGKVYNPRKPLRASTCIWGNLDQWPNQIIVERTHDVERARALAANWWGDLDSETDLEDALVELRWMRLVPWSDSDDYSQTWIDDEEHGVPCVCFRVSER